MPPTPGPRREVAGWLTRRLSEAGPLWRAIACCGLALGACEKSPAAPATSGGFDPAAASSALAVVTGVAGTTAMLSLTALSPLLKVAAAPPLATPPAPAIACAPAVPRSAARPPSPAAAGPLAPLATGLIADSLFRHVFVYDTATRAYVVSADTTGPAGGIRFLLYGVNSYSLPASPLAIDGWLDLTDQSTGSAFQLRSQLSNGTSGIADYVVGLSGTQAADTALLSGTVTDGTHTLKFTDSTGGAPVSGSVGVQVAVSVHLSDSLAGFSVDMRASRVSFDPFDFNDDIDLTLTDAPQTLRMTGAIRTYCLVPSIGLQVSVNGTPYATISNGTTTPNVTLVGGQSAPADVSQALLGMMAAQQQLFQWLGALFAPAKALLP